MTLYETLGVAKDATADAIKAAFHAAAKRTHPDVGGDIEDFQEVNLAYEVLSDPDMRAKYDNGEPINAGHINDERRKALAVIESLLADAIGEIIKSQGEPVYADIVATMRRIINERMQKLDEAVADAIQKIERLKGLAGRFIVPEGKDNVVAHMVEYRIRGIYRQIDDAEAQRANHKLALEILADVSFRFDKPQVLQVFNTGLGAGVHTVSFGRPF